MKLENIGFYTLEDLRAKNTSVHSPLWRCELLITSKCNFKCPYCRGTSKDADISFDYAKYVVDLWAKEGLKNVRFSGGEPTTVKWLPELIKYAKSKKIERIAISTNGSQTLEYYKNLHTLGVNDFSISLDACCSSYADKMAGVNGYFERVCNNIAELSKITYVTVGCVFDENNYEQSLRTVLLADRLGVSDIRIISSAQFNKALEFVKQIPKNILSKYPILSYRVNNFINGRNVRGIKEKDNHKCPLILDDMAIKGNYHFPCIIKLREGCAPIGRVGKSMRAERLKYYQKHDCFADEICRKNCLDVCIDYNNKVRELQALRIKGNRLNEEECKEWDEDWTKFVEKEKVNRKNEKMIPKINPNTFTWQLWRGGCLLDLGIQINRTNCILANKRIIRAHAIGYCKGEELSVRPKNDSFGVMFQNKEVLFWTHLTKEEFKKIFI